MRSPARIDKFCSELAEIWKANACDWRFGQLVMNVLNSQERDPWFFEEEEMIELFRSYFNHDEEDKENTEKDSNDKENK